MAGLIGGTLQGLDNLISGGNWKQSGGELATQAFNAEEAEKARVFSAQEAEKTRAFNAEQALLQREFEANLSNTAYSRAVNDLRNAGLNPYLAYSQGGATVPSGASASAPTAMTATASTNQVGKKSSNVSGVALGVANLALSAFKLGILGTAGKFKVGF